MQNNNNNNRADSELTDAGSGIDMSRIFSKALNILPWVIISVILALVLAKIYLRYAVPVYSIKTQILIKDERLSGGDKGIVEQLGISSSANKSIDNEIDILSSYELNKQVVDSLHLDLEIQEEGRIKKSFVYGSTAPFIVKYCKRNKEEEGAVVNFISKPTGIDVENVDGTFKFYPYNDTIFLKNNKMVLVPNPNFLFNAANKQKLFFRPVSSAVGRYKGGLKLALTKEYGGVLEISMNDAITERGIDVLNKLIETYLAAGLEDKNVVGKNTVKFLNERIANVTKDLIETEQRVADFQSKNRVMPSITGSSFSNAIGEARVSEKALTDVIVRMSALDDIEKYIKSSRSTEDIIPVILGVSEPVVSSMIFAHNEIVARRQKSRQTGMAGDPAIQTFDEQIADQRKNILKTITQVRNNMNRTLDLAKKENQKVLSDISILPGKESILLDMSREVTVKSSILDFLMRKREETELTLASNRPDVRIIESPRSMGMVKPVASQIILFAFFIGLGIPVIILLLLEFFNNTIGLSD